MAAMRPSLDLEVDSGPGPRHRACRARRPRSGRPARGRRAASSAAGGGIAGEAGMRFIVSSPGGWRFRASAAAAGARAGSAPGRCTMPVSEISSERREHARDLAAGSRPRGCGRRGPRRVPPVPATNSATTAPISARPPEIRRPAEEIGQRRRQPQIAQRLPARRAIELEQVDADCGRPSSARAWCSTGSGRRRRSRRRSAATASMSLTQMMISGAIATIGVTCRMTA